MLSPAEWKNEGTPHRPPECVLAEQSDYDGGDPDLSLVKRRDGLYDFVIYKGTDDLTCHALTADQVRGAAWRILNLVPETK